MHVRQLVLRVPLQLAQEESQQVLLMRVRLFSQAVQEVAEPEQVEQGEEQAEHSLVLVR